MYKVQYKSSNAGSAWTTSGTYASESTALSNASKIAGKYFMVRVIDNNGNTIWSA